MAEKGFGVKEINLIGASGTPTIESPNNLNLNAINVAISTNVSIGGTLSVTGNVSVGGTLTYEDVTNIDSVGLITAREGIKIPDDKYVYLGSDNDLEITHTGSNGNINNKTGDLVIRTLGSGDDIFIDAVDDVNIRVQSTDNAITCIGDGAVTLHYNGGAKLATTNTGVNVTGTLAATAVTGDGSGLTSLPAATPTDSDIQVVYTVTANGSSAYRFAGNGVVSTADDPDLYLIRGQKYRFINNSGGSHPFQIREASGGTAYSTGVTNNGASSGNIDFAPTFDSPAQLVYQCTSHSGMVGNIYLRDAAGGNTTVGVSTFSGKVTIESSVNPTYNKGNFGPGSLTLQNNSADNTVDFSQGIVFTDNANNESNGGWVHAAICTVGTTGYNGNIIFGVDGNGAANNNLSGITEQLRIANDGFVSFGGDADLGFIRSGTNTLQCKTNGTLCTEFAANQRVRMPQVYSTNGSNMRDVQIESDGTLCAGNTSIRLSKKNITSQSDVSWLYNLNPVTFNYRKKIVDKVTGEHTYLEEVEEETSYGLIAEEVETIKKDFCFYNNNKLAGVHYNQLITPLLKSLQDQKKEIDILKAEVAALKAK